VPKATTKMKTLLPQQSRNVIFITVVLLLLASSLPACSTSTSEPVSLFPVDRLPEEVRSAPLMVKEAYQFAAANPEVLRQVPCYCGCGSMGHTSNYSCYVAGESPDGNLDFDNHAMGCSICVDITQDAIRLLKQGRSAPEIRAYVDDAYGRYRTSNMPSQ